MINENLYTAILERTQGFEQRTLERIGERIKKIGKINTADSKALKNIADITGDMAKIQADLEKITALNNAELLEIYKGSISRQNIEAKELAELANRPFTPIPYVKNTAAQRIVENLFRETVESLSNFANTSALGFRGADGQFIGLGKMYKQVVDKAIVAVTSGTTDFYSEMRDTIKELGGSGVRVQYGKSTRRLDTSIRQNMLWGNKQVYQNYDEHIGKQLGCDIFFVDYHPNPRPTHAFLGGGQFSTGKAMTIKGEYYADGTQALERLQDYGCLHTKKTGIAGVSQNPYDKKQLEKWKKEDNEPVTIDGVEMTKYEAKQQMRKLETAIRYQKDTANLAKASGGMQLRREAQTKINALQAKYDRITEQSGLQPTKERMSVSGFRAVKAE